jgi:AcrR family transcriptional regulator
VHQAQIGYHVGPKDDLWRATVDFLFARLRAELDRAVTSDPDEPVNDPVEVFADVIRRHVRHTARHPELSRIMLMETAGKSPRVDWLLKNHVRPALAALQLVWADVRAAGRGRDLPAEEVFMLMIGLAPTPFAQAGLMRPLLGAERCTPERHAQVMTEWILG